MSNGAQNPPTPALYVALGVDVGASAEEIAKAFRKASLMLHPDRNIGVPPEDLNDAFHRVSSAYAVLSAPIARRAYDAKHGVNFRSRIADLASVAQSAPTESEDFSSESDRRKRARSDASLENNKECTASNSDAEEEEEYQPAVCAIDKEEEVVHDNVQSLPTWSAVEVTTRQQVTLSMQRAEATQPWGLECTVVDSKEVVGYAPPPGGAAGTCVALNRTFKEGTPASKLPRSSSVGLVILESVDGVPVRSVADLVACLSVTREAELALSLPCVHTVRVTSAESSCGAAWRLFHSSFAVDMSSFRIVQRDAPLVSSAAADGAPVPAGVTQLLVGSRLLGARLLHAQDGDGSRRFTTFNGSDELQMFVAIAAEAQGGTSLELLISN